ARGDVHDHQSRPVRLDHGDADHQPATGGDPRPRGGGQAAGRPHRCRGQRLDRHPAHDHPRSQLGSPGARRGFGGAVSRRREAAPGELPMGEEWYRMQGIEIFETDRGGKVTYHGPGQLVGYPIVRVDDVVAYVRTLERALATALANEGVEARARPEDGPDYTG